METVKNYQTLKSELKQLAVELRTDKAEIKKIQKEDGSGAAYAQQSSILYKKKNCRHRHIAYSIMRGRTYEQIEQKCRKGNSPDQNLIQEIIRAYGTQDVCAGA
jgi:cytochrome c551/c552